MTWRGELGTLILVTVVTLLIWLLAAARTQEIAPIAGGIDFVVAGDTAGDRFKVSPNRIPVTVTVEGAALAVRRARQLISGAALEIPLQAEDGRQEIASLQQAVQRLEAIRSTGIEIVAVDPPEVVVDIAEFVPVQAVVREEIKSASTVQDVSVTPEQVTVIVPKAQVDRLPETLMVDAVIDPREVARLEPGVLQTVRGTLHLPDDLSIAGPVRIEPATALVSFQLVARQRRAVVPRVRVQVISSAQDFGQYAVDLPEPILHDVEIEAAPERIAQVESGQAQVVALVHLSTNDKEKGIDRKAVSGFAIIGADGRAEPVAGTLDGQPHPQVVLSITPIEQP